MEKILFSAVALLCSVAAMAQAPAAVSPALAKAAAIERKQDARTKQHDADDDRNYDKAAKPDNHGQNVSTFAKTTTLTGADKGAAVSAVARDSRDTGHTPRSGRGGEHGQRGSRATGSSHAGAGHAGAGHGHGH